MSTHVTHDTSANKVVQRVKLWKMIVKMQDLQRLPIKKNSRQIVEKPKDEEFQQNNPEIKSQRNLASYGIK